MMTPITPPGRIGDTLRDLFHVRLCRLGCGAVRVEPRAERGVGRDVLDHPGQSIDEVPEGTGERREQEQREDDSERR